MLWESGRKLSSDHRFHFVQQEQTRRAESFFAPFLKLATSLNFFSFWFRRKADSRHLRRQHKKKIEEAANDAEARVSGLRRCNSWFSTCSDSRTCRLLWTSRICWSFATQVASEAAWHGPQSLEHCAVGCRRAAPKWTELDSSWQFTSKLCTSFFGQVSELESPSLNHLWVGL